MKKYMSVFLLAVGMMACTKELEQVNPNTLTETNYWKTDNDFLSALASTYKVFRDVNNGYWGVRGIETTNGRGDDFFIRNDVKDLYQLSTFTNNPTTGTPGSLFSGFYRQHGLSIGVLPTGKHDAITDVSGAVIAATEEAILNSLIKAEAMVGNEQPSVPALPLEKVIPILKKYHALK